jgi:hypothetical protein
MPWRLLPALLVFTPLGVIIACSSDEPSPAKPDGATETGGASGSGGASNESDARVPGSGGAAATGGSSGAGGCAPSCGTIPDAATPEKDAEPASGGAPGDAQAPPSPTCAAIADACEIIDSPQQPQALHDCVALRGADEATCAAGLDGCRALCAPSLCVRLGSFCHDPDPGSGPLHECHEFNHRGAASGASPQEIAWCFDEAPRCFALCEAAQ